MSQIFEFHFNPKSKEDLIFDSFCFEPTNIYEKRMGSLYMVGLLKNALSQNNKFLGALAEKIKEKYYKAVSVPSEKSLKDSLKTANEYLEKIAKKGDVSWLGNLSFTVISLRGFEFNFTKVGDLKLLLFRRGQIIDIEQKINFDDFEPYPLKIFGNIVSGKLAENDILLVLNEEVYDFFLKENLLDEIARKPIKNFKNTLNNKKEQLTKISGICLLMVLDKEAAIKEKETLDEKKPLEIFSFIKKIPIPKIKIPLPKIGFPRINFPKISPSDKKKEKIRILPKLPKIRQHIFCAPSRASRGSEGGRRNAISSPSDKLKKKAILILILIIFFLLGFLIFEKKEEARIKNHQTEINRIQEKINQAEYYLDMAEYSPGAKENANTLYKEAWGEISLMTDILSKLPSVTAGQVLNLKNTVSKNLETLNKLKEISEPDLVFEFKARELIPQKILFFKNELYFFTSHSDNVFKLNQEHQKEIIEINQKISLAAPFSDSIIFFSKPNQIIILKENRPGETVYLKEPAADFNFIDFNSYRSHLYFLDAKNNSIIRYPFASQDEVSSPSELKWKKPESWLAPEIKTAVDFKSMAVDGSIWILTERNAIERYYLGRLQETIDLEIFPKPKNFSKIFTSPQHPYLYILEPAERRIVILDKSGRIIHQFQSEKFKNLLDFAVSENGKTIWLLNGLKVYQLSI